MRLNANNFYSISLNKDGSYHICIVSDDQACMYEQMVTFLAQNAYGRHILSKKKIFGDEVNYIKSSTNVYQLFISPFLLGYRNQ